jgi:acyl carrier protein
MTNLEKLRLAFTEGLGMDAARVRDDLQYGNPGWDSVGHMALVAAIERKFDLMLETDDVIGMSSFAKAKEIVSKYGITFESPG